MKNFKRLSVLSTVFVLALLVITHAANAATYYVSDTTGSDSYTAAQAQNQATPWKTIDKVESSSSTIQAGDSILFKRGDNFTGVASSNKVFTWSKSGTASARITFGSYGTGAKPTFQYPIPSPLPANWATQAQNRIYMYITGSYITIDGLNFTDTTIADNDKVARANMGAAIYFSYYGNVTGNYEIVRNSDFSKIGLGIVLNGNNGLIENNTFVDLKNLVDTCYATATKPCPSGAITGGQYEDYGANGITLDGNDHLIQHNYFSGNFAASSDFGWNGGAIEAYSAGTLNRMKVLYNTFIDNGGIIEYGSGNNASISDNLFAYNLMINNGDLAWTQYSSQFTTLASNIQFFNNTIIENSASRFKKTSSEATMCPGIPHGTYDQNGVNTGVATGYPTCMYAGMLFAYGATPPASITTTYSLKNNIYDISTQMRVKGSGNDSQFVHENNIYKLSGSATQGFGSLNSSEKSTSSAVVTNFAGAVPTVTNYMVQPQANFALPATSIAINAGTNVGITTDLAGTTITGTPDSGTYEYTTGGTGGDATPPTVSISAPANGSTISGTTTVSATAADNVGVTSVTFKLDGVVQTIDASTPYSTTWDSTASANGSHTWTATATDAAGNTATTSSTYTVSNSVADTIAPTVSFTTPVNGSNAVGTISMIVAASDNVGVVGVQFKVDGTNFGSEDTTTPYSTTWNTTTYTNGSHTVTATARDAAGNTTTATSVVNVNNADTTVPTVAFSAPAAGATVSGTTTISATASDNVAVANVKFQLDGIDHTTDTTAPYAATWITTGVANGSHTWTAIATDTSGNTASTTRSFTVNNPDVTAPTVAFTSPLSGSTITGSTTLAATASDNLGVAGVQFKLDGSTIGAEDVSAPYQMSWDSTTTTNGSHTLTAVARDAAGNTATATSVVTVSNTIPDTTNPTVSFSSPAAGSTVTDTVTISATASDNIAVASVRFQLDGVDYVTDTAPSYDAVWTTTASTNGSHTWTAIATDTSGNTASTTRSFMVNNTVVVNPSVPTGLTATTIGAQITLTWTPSTGDVGGYKIYRDGVYMTQVASPTFTDTTTVTGMTYSYTVSAVNASNTFESAQSIPVVVSTAPAATMFQTTALRVNVRSNPTTWAAGHIIGTQPKGAIGTQIPGTLYVNANGYTWVDVDFQTGADGWVVTRYLTEYVPPAGRSTTTTTRATTTTTALVSTDPTTLQMLDLLQQASRAATSAEANRLIQQAQKLQAK